MPKKSGQSKAAADKLVKRNWRFASSRWAVKKYACTDVVPSEFAIFPVIEIKDDVVQFAANTQHTFDVIEGQF